MNKSTTIPGRQDIRAPRQETQNRPALTVDQLNVLLLTLYEASQGRSPWEAFLDQLCRLMPARSAVLGFTEPDPQSHDLTFVGGHPDNAGRTRRIGHCSESTPPLPVGVPTMLADWPKLGIDIVRKNTVGLYLQTIRRHDDKPFGQPEKVLLGLLEPHLRQVLSRLDQERLQRIERSLYQGVTHQLAIGTVLLDGSGAVVRSDAIARHHLDGGKFIHLRNRKLVATRSPDNRRLQTIVQHCVNGIKRDCSTPQAIAISDEGAEQRLFLLIKSLRPPASAVPTGNIGMERLFDLAPDDSPIAAVHISTFTPLTNTHQRLLQQLFDFTPKEANMAIALANGLCIDEIAKSYCVSRNTLRTHLVKAYQKAGVNRQSALVSVILRSISGLG